MTKKRLIIPLFLIVIIIAVILLYSWRYKLNNPHAPVEATGIIETIEVDVSPEIQEKIEWLCCEEGIEVKRGDLLVRLSDRKLAARVNEGRALLTGAVARLEEARANLENSKARVESARAVVQAAQSEIDRSRALNEDARGNFNRISELFKDGYTTKKDMDTAKAAFDAATAQMSAAESKKASEEASVSTAMAGVKSAEAQVSSAKAAIEEARAGLKLSETLFKDSVITSPVNGVITYKAFEIGETAIPGKAIYTIHDMQKIWARVDVEETDVGRIRLNGKAVISSNALPDKRFDGEVTEIGREAAFATQRDVSRGRQDIKTFRVKVGVKKPDGLLKPGMTVVVKFLP
ncbi:MAG: efflux RND transporter periplasmic adaptor subunit [Nitrospirae bacterium]|nr:efflux RND transporter periplasmic adaptor subunit [Nitrospirota bacterium]